MDFYVTVFGSKHYKSEYIIQECINKKKFELFLKFNKFDNLNSTWIFFHKATTPLTFIDVRDETTF